MGLFAGECRSLLWVVCDVEVSFDIHCEHTKSGEENVGLF